MSVTSHLKDLLTKMGGTPKAGDSTSVLIDKIEDVYASGGGGGSSGGVSSYNDLTDRPFDVTKGYTILFEETVTVEERAGVYGAQLAYTGGLDEDIIKVTFDGTEYICEKYTPDGFPEGSWFYGGIYSENGAAAEEDRLDFSDYPFIIGPNNTIMTEMPGTHAVKVVINSENIFTTEDFKKAVKSINDSGSGSGSSDTLVVMIYADDMVDNPNNTAKPNVILKMNRTYNEILNAYETGKNVDFIFEAKKMALPSGSPTLTLVLHNDHSTLESYGLPIHISNMSIDVMTVATYSSLQPSENEYVLIGRQGIVNQVTLGVGVNASNEYGIEIVMDGIAFEEPFTCQNGNDYPSYTAEGSLK